MDIDFVRRKKYAPHWHTEVGWCIIPKSMPDFRVPLPCADSDPILWRQYTFTHLNHGVPEFEVMEVGIMEHTEYRERLMRGKDPYGLLDWMSGDFSVSVSFPSKMPFTRWFAQYDDALKFASRWMRAHIKGMSQIERDADRCGKGGILRRLVMEA